MKLPGHLRFAGRNVLIKYHKLQSGSGATPPNSLAALHEVVERGAEAIEFDVSLTADDRFALLHDQTLERETTGVGPLRHLTLAEAKRLRLRDTGEHVVALDEVVAYLKAVERPLKVQVDLKELRPLTDGEARSLVTGLGPLLDNARLLVVVGCLADWNLRALHRLEGRLQLGLDFAYHLDAVVDRLIRLPTRVNAYGYLDDHPLGWRRLQAADAYLIDRVETLLGLVPSATEFYLRAAFVRQALEDGFDPIAFIHQNRPGSLVDIWTIDRHPDGSRDAQMWDVLRGGADQITTNTALQWSAALGNTDAGGEP